MDILKSKTVTMLTGRTFVNPGLSSSQILKVGRQGVQFDKCLISDLSTSNRTWAIVGHPQKILFRSDTPATEDEEIFIIYKITT